MGTARAVEEGDEYNSVSPTCVVSSVTNHFGRPPALRLRWSRDSILPE